MHLGSWVAFGFILGTCGLPDVANIRPGSLCEVVHGRSMSFIFFPYVASILAGLESILGCVLICLFLCSCALRQCPIWKRLQISLNTWGCKTKRNTCTADIPWHQSVRNTREGGKTEKKLATFSLRYVHRLSPR